MDRRQGPYSISTDKERLDVGLIHEYLSLVSYWAQGRPRRMVEESIAASVCFGVYEGSEQVGFARVVTDGVTFAWLCDLFVIESRQGQGLGKWLVESVVLHPQLRDLKLFLLATRDAQELYHKYGGFEEIGEPERWMVRTRKDT